MKQGVDDALALGVRLTECEDDDSADFDPLQEHFLPQKSILPKVAPKKTMTGRHPATYDWAICSVCAGLEAEAQPMTVYSPPVDGSSR